MTKNINSQNESTAEAPASEDKGMKKKLDHLTKLCSPAYSISGYMPTAATWKLTPEQVKTIVLNIVKRFLNDVQNVTLDVNHKSGAVNTLVWIPIDSKNLKDTSAMSDNSAIRRSLTRYSPELKEFMDKFCDDDKKRTVNEDTNLPVVGIEVRLERFLRIEFDENGEQFSKEYNIPGKSKAKITLSAKYTKGDDSGFGRLKFIEVQKSLRSDLDRFEPRPKRSYNA